MAVKSSSETPSIYITHLTDEVLRRDEKLKQPPQPVGVHLAAESAEAVVPVALGLRGDVVDNNLKCSKVFLSLTIHFAFHFYRIKRHSFVILN